MNRNPDQLSGKAVAIDPAVSNNENSDETGIIVGGRADDGHAYVIADYSLKASPDGLGTRSGQGLSPSPCQSYHR